MDEGYADKMIQMLDTVLVGVDAKQRDVMKQWAHREMTQKPLIIRATCRQWVNAYVDERANPPTRVPAGYHTLSWEAGQPSPSNPDALIFAMLQVDDDHVKVFSFQLADFEGKETAVYFHETLYRPDVTYGPISGDALFEEWANFFATEDELEKLQGSDGKKQHANGAAS